ncbi:hemolysin III family protein [Stagnimonas aquatica]|uniref:Hemolysin III family protein n=1 Tax=Stagnimonas aquatica TaxID=2689987 RepID=A0A3N0VM15_9GAMM|nr:hemolysin III family protein [Stagnimonas aquatica]ROH93068.1 hemolysin III family protein [Stagnimonas aquatica]
MRRQASPAPARPARVRVTLPDSIYSLGEEIAHALSHGVGAFAAIAGLAVLVAKAALYGNAWHVVSASVFGATLILMYTASALFHSIPLPRSKQVLRVIDHCCIYLLIAGTYTPFTLVTLHGPWGWSLFALTWGLAAVGVVFKIFTTGRYEALSLAVYLAMGWCAVLAIKPLLAALPAGGLWLLLAGGLSYSLGVVFYAWEKLPYHHAIWHLFVLAGSVLHYFAVLFYVIPSGAIGGG